LNQCSFCGRSEEQVKKLIAGAHAFICDECVAMCSEVLTAGGELPTGEGVGTEGTETARPPRGKAGWTGYDPAPRDDS
jgi:ATP-dependent Clp protease ATP-binding subunit ClpX